MLHNSLLNTLVIAALLALPSSSFANKKLTQLYVSIYKNISVSEMRRSGIPASIKLAQGILESDLGRSDLAKKANNHFGIKCGSDWKGELFFKHDDEVDSTGFITESCFRAFQSPLESYIAHSDFLTNPVKQSRYGFLFKLETTDYVGWANGLSMSGYASDPSYASKLIAIIEAYQLYKYDEPLIAVKKNTDIAKGNSIPSNMASPLKEEKLPVFTSPENTLKPLKNIMQKAKYVQGNINNTKMMYAAGGETVSELARRTAKNVFEILEYNEGLSSQDEILEPGQIIFLERKKKSFLDENTAFHIVSKNETMYLISQKYGIRLENLLAKNNLTEDARPLSGEKISLIKNVKESETPRYAFVEKFVSYVDLGGIK